jgi:ElaB/YqjD/DUF883 family membrane-anchored ribosome-binding protein
MKSKRIANKMNNQQLNTKVNHDADKVKKDLNTLVGDSAVRLSRFEDNVSQATGKVKEDLSSWVEGGVSQLSEGYEKLKGDARDSVVSAAATVKKDVGQGLNQYNMKAQEVADQVPGGFSEKAARYPWVTISFALALGFLLGNLFRPTRRPIEQIQI